MMKLPFSSRFVLGAVLTVGVGFLLAPRSVAQSAPLEDAPFRPSPSVVKGTIFALSDSSPEVVVIATRAMADWREPSAAAEVARLLKPETSPSVRLEALRYFTRLGSQAKPQVAEVIKQVSDPDPNIRSAVLGVVLASGTAAEHLDALSKLLDDKRSDVRSAAARCLGQAGAAAAAHREALLKALAKAGTGDFKEAALRAIGQIGGLSIADIETVRPYTRDRDAEVRVAAWTTYLNGLVAAKTKGLLTAEQFESHRKVFVPRFETEPADVRTAVTGEASGDAATIRTFMPGLLGRLKGNSPELKAAALHAIGKAGAAGLEQVPLIVEQAKAPDPTVRAGAIAALGLLGPAAVKPNVAVVANALLDQSDIVRDEALAALPAGGEALANFPYRIRDVYATVSPEVRASLVKAAAITTRFVPMDDEVLARCRSALVDPNPDLRIGMAFVMGQLGDKSGKVLLPDMLPLLKDPEAEVRGAATIALCSFLTDAAAKKKFRELLRPLLKDPDSQVRWAALDTLHELDLAQEPALVEEIAALTKDEDQTVRSGAVRALGSAGAAAKPHLLEIIQFFIDDPAVPPYAAAEAVLEMSPLTPQELTSLLYPLYVYPELLPLTRAVAYGASGGEKDGLLIARLLGQTRAAAKDIVPTADAARVTALLQDSLKAPLLHDQLKAEIEARIKEVQALR